jgi:hypothetical protein
MQGAGQDNKSGIHAANRQGPPMIPNPAGLDRVSAVDLKMALSLGALNPCSAPQSHEGAIIRPNAMKNQASLEAYTGEKGRLCGNAVFKRLLFSRSSAGQKHGRQASSKPPPRQRPSPPARGGCGQCPQSGQGPPAKRLHTRPAWTKAQ